MGSYKPLEGEAALLLEAHESVLIVADLHIGLESQFAKKGIHFPSQTPLIEDKLKKLINEYMPSKLVVLGDVKHNIPGISIQEWKEIPRLFKNLAKLVNIEIFPGNHDGNLEKLIPKNIVYQPSKGST
ncbi:MAG: metallophosphoesterase, partial [Promethearchaeota archaeon]